MALCSWTWDCVLQHLIRFSCFYPSLAVFSLSGVFRLCFMRLLKYSIILSLVTLVTYSSWCCNISYHSDIFVLFIMVKVCNGPVQSLFLALAQWPLASSTPATLNRSGSWQKISEYWLKFISLASSSESVTKNNISMVKPSPHIANTLSTCYVFNTLS